MIPMRLQLVAALAITSLICGIAQADYFAKNPSIFGRVVKSFDRYNRNKPTPAPPVMTADTPQSALPMPRVQRVDAIAADEGKVVCRVLPPCDWSEGTPTALEMIAAAFMTEEVAVRSACEVTARELQKWNPIIDERRCTNPYSFHDRADLFPLPSMIAYAAAEIYDVNYSEVIECPLINGGFLFLPESMFNAKKVVQEMKPCHKMKTIFLILVVLIMTFLAIAAFLCLTVCCQRCRIRRKNSEDERPKLESWRRLSQSHQKIMATLPRSGEESEKLVGGVDTDEESLGGHHETSRETEPLYAVVKKEESGGR